MPQHQRARSTNLFVLLPSLLLLVTVWSFAWDVDSLTRAHDQPKHPHPVNQSVSFAPYLIAIPGSDLNSSSLLVSAAGIDQIDAPVYLSIGQGGTSHRHSYTMGFDSDSQSYRLTLESFFENLGHVASTMEITTTNVVSTTMTSGERRYERWPISQSQFVAISTVDGFLQLVFNANTLPADPAYILVVDTHAPVAAPTGWRSVSTAYSIQPSGAVQTASRNYLLILKYIDERLQGADPTDLAIHRFNMETKQWDRIGGEVDPKNSEITLSTKEFGTFMLFVVETEPTDTPTPTDTAIPTHTPTSTATPTATSTASSPHTPTPTATMTPTATAVNPWMSLFLPSIRNSSDLP